MGSKYIVEIEKLNEFSPEKTLYNIRGTGLYVEKEVIDRLEKYDPDKIYREAFDAGELEGEKRVKKKTLGFTDYMRGYRKGLNDAWEAAKEFFGDYVICLDDREQLTKNEVAEKYRLGTRLCKSISLLKSFFDAGPEYAIESLRLWKEKSEEIRVGDEVIVNGLMGVVMKLGEKGNIDRYFTCDGKTFGNISGFQNNEVKKTGRHFPQVAELLEKMKEVEEND